jgi:predicted dehydrogenase/threonine dehydrogenase-like Zn-dependent dehydrogenase
MPDLARFRQFFATLIPGDLDLMKQVVIQGGGVLVQDVPAPCVSPKNILVRVKHSCISVGTEMAGVANSGLPIYRRALKQPEHAKKVLDMMRDQGVKRTLDRVLGKLAAGLPTGYSAAGEVVEVGCEVAGFRVGDMVACAGAGIANHADYIDVPVNLAVKVPSQIGTEWAATVTLGAIAMQGVRRANPTLGEAVVVVGLGVLGQLTAQFLKVNGCRVIGVDIDPKRIELALENGMDFGLDPSTESYIDRVHRLTDGFGADAVVVTAANASDEIISQAMQACRKKGRVVLVGDVGLDIKRSDMYKKELDFLISCSYGPGRYDSSYEEGGQDYPLPYVRWTENRNMETYLHLLANGQVKLNNLSKARFPIEEAPAAYESLKSGSDRPLMVILEYPNTEAVPSRTVQLRSTSSKEKTVRVALAGAGNFAAGMHLPNMVKLRDRFTLRGVMSRTGSNARGIANQFQASYATTDFDEILSDPDVDLVLIATRHDLHGSMVMRALHAGKHVFVEKPLTLNPADLDEIAAFYRSQCNPPLLMTGYNRRFSLPLQRAREVLKNRATPMIVNYRMNAGYIPLEHWVHTAEGGGRNLGEACHIYDLFNFLTGSKLHKVTAAAIAPSSKQYVRNDNFIATIEYSDGSLCSLTYTALGDKLHPKEMMEIFADGKVISLRDYKALTIAGGKHKGWESMTQQKGQLQELEALADCLLKQNNWPISLEDQLQTSRISFEVERQITAAGTSTTFAANS